MKRILVADDDAQIRRVLRTALQSSGYEVSLAENGLAAFTKFESEKPDLVITDLAMPEMDGVALTREIRRVSDTPVLVLSVRDSDLMKVNALDNGADDYLTKPFSTPELLARIRAVLRRTDTPQPAQGRIAAGDFVIDAEAHAATVRGEPVHLTPKEFDLLLALARSPGRVLTHKFLLQAVWGAAGADQPEYLRVLVASLRRKIEPSGTPQYIVNEPWVGYRFLPGDTFTAS